MLACCVRDDIDSYELLSAGRRFEKARRFPCAYNYVLDRVCKINSLFRITVVLLLTLSTLSWVPVILIVLSIELGFQSPKCLRLLVMSCPRPLPPCLGLGLGGIVVEPYYSVLW